MTVTEYQNNDNELSDEDACYFNTKQKRHWVTVTEYYKNDDNVTLFKEECVSQPRVMHPQNAINTCACVKNHLVQGILGISYSHVEIRCSVLSIAGVTNPFK